jgi:hypothetical protein
MAESIAVAEALLSAGVPIAFALDGIRRAGRRTLKPPVSIAWFSSAVLDLWSNEGARHLRIVRSSSGSSDRAKQPGSPSERKEDRGVLEAKLEYERMSRESGVRWSSDPANADAYRAIADRIWAPYGERERKLSWVVKGCEQNILLACAEAAGFPTFDVWFSEHTAGEWDSR